LVSVVIIGLCTLLGVGAFLAPFLQAALAPTTAATRVVGSPLLVTALLTLCLLAMLFEAQTATEQAPTPGQGITSVALLGVLIAINATLRYIENVLPGPGGFTPIFVLIIVTGYVLGGMAGLLTGALTLLVSALITGGVGPWLPYQMFAAAWVGLSAPLCRPLVRWVQGEGRWREVLILAAFGAIWGFVFGAIMNLWSWPYTSGPPDQYWQPGIAATAIFERYLRYYLLTSVVWDAFGAAGNAILMALLGMPVLKVLRRFQRRLTFRYQAANPTLGEHP
jgi:energy-coupling factor transport system substrate-specific component